MGTEGAGCARLSWSGARAAASSSSGVPVPRLGRSSGHSGCRTAAPSLEEVAAGQLRARGALQPQRGAGSAPGRGTALSSLSARPARPRGCERRNRRGSGADGAALPPAVLRLLCWRLGNTKLASLQEDFAGAASPLPKGCSIPFPEDAASPSRRRAARALPKHAGGACCGQAAAGGALSIPRWPQRTRRVRQRGQRGQRRFCG